MDYQVGIPGIQGLMAAAWPELKQDSFEEERQQLTSSSLAPAAL